MNRPARLTVPQAVDMLRHAETAELMDRADRFRRELHGSRAYYVHSLNLNPTNICENRCRLCAFWREADAKDAYRMTLDDARRRLEQAREWELTDLHIVGGLTPELNLAYYEALIGMCRTMLPGVLVQGLTAVEIQYLADREGLSVRRVLERLKAAGLGAIPGGGAEIFDSSIREHICEKKISAEKWLAVHEQAHALGLPSNATVLFGHVESPEAIVDHLNRLRELQDRTGGFQAIVALPFHPEGTQIQAVGPGGYTVARVVSLARLFLDNVPHVRVLANYVDRKLMQVLTQAGADDLGGTSLDERIARAAGAPESHRIASTAEMESFLADLGLHGVLVNSRYEPVSGGKVMVGASVEAVPVTPAGVAFPNAVMEKALHLAERGGRLSAGDALALYEGATLGQLGLLAHRRRMQVVPHRRVTYVLDRNVSFTNVCQAGCRFCAFHVEEGSEKSFAMSIDEITAVVSEAAGLGATQMMLQGGLNPALDLPFYETMLAAVRRVAPGIRIHSLSPAEVLYLARRNGLTVEACLCRLRLAGLDSLPGGGAEILVEDVRREVSPHKISAADWLGVMETAHKLGMKTTATMVYGLGETPAQRVAHLLAVRNLQDRTGGFTAFIPWSFQPNRTRMTLRAQTGADYLRMVALSRLVLDNVPHVQAGWVTEGPDVAQLALSFGADDWGGVLMEERVVRATGVSYQVTREQVVAIIREMGFTPAQRTTQYEILREL